MHKLLFIAVLLLSVGAVYALDIPAPQGYVSDFADLFSPAEEARIAALAQAIEENLTVEIAVVTIVSLEGEDVFDYSFRLASEWGVGKGGNDNGLVLLIAQEEREYFFQVGKGLEGVLNDARVGRIGRETLVPYFQRGEYGEGVVVALVQVKGLVGNDPS